MQLLISVYFPFKGVHTEQDEIEMFTSGICHCGETIILDFQIDANFCPSEFREVLIGASNNRTTLSYAKLMQSS